MLDTPPSTPTRQLFEDFIEQLSRLAALEARLFRSELRETSTKLVSAAGLIAGAIVLALSGIIQGQVIRRVKSVAAEYARRLAAAAALADGQVPSSSAGGCSE